MGLVLWIDANTFATGILEKVFKSKSLPFYSLTDPKDFLYLIDDLGPQILVLDALTIKAEEERFLRLYESSQSLRALLVVVIGNESDLPFVQNRIGFIKRPFDPFEIPDILANFLHAH